MQFYGITLPNLFGTRINIYIIIYLFIFIIHEACLWFCIFSRSICWTCANCLERIHLACVLFCLRHLTDKLDSSQIHTLALKYIYIYM